MDDPRVVGEGGAGVAIGRFSLRGLFYYTAAIAVFMAALYNPGGPFARFVAAQILIAILVAVGAYTGGKIESTEPAKRHPTDWIIPATCLVLMNLAVVQIVVELQMID